MRYLAKSGLLLVCICLAYALFAFLDEEQAETGRHTTSQVENANQGSVEDPKFEIDVSTGFAVLVYYSNSILFTTDITKDQSKKLFEHFTQTSFFTNTSVNRIIIGKEPNNFVLFYQPDKPGSIPYLQLQAFAVGISVNVLNHQPLVVKLINEEKEVVRIVTSL